MTPRRKEPVWLIEQIVLAIHDDLLARHGGLFGLRDAGLFESALARPRMVSGSPKNHANYGNKRTAFQSMYTFLGLNGAELDASEVDAVQIMVSVADGSISEKRLAAWLRDNTALPRGTRKAPK